MAERVISKRIFFPKGEQAKLIENAQTKMSLDNDALAAMIGKSVRTITDWKREKFSMNLEAAKVISRMSGIKIGGNCTVKEAYWYTATGSSAGGRAVYKKYGVVGGDQEHRKKKWYAWWRTKGKFQKHPILNVTKPIRKPPFSAKLAEFTGVILGDGGVSKRQVVVTLHRYDDEVYGKFIRELVSELFNVVPGTYKDPKCFADDIVISRTELVRFCVDKIGLKIGSKVRQQVDVPQWIKDNEKYATACLRGLIDTDGCLIKHRYSVGGKKYLYKKLSFSNSSNPLISFALEQLHQLNIKARVTKNKKEVRIDGQSEMRKYFRIVGSHNPKHVSKWLGC